MRIVVNDIAASKGGAMTVLKDFYRCVCENDSENEWIFLLGDKYFEETERVKIVALPEIKKSPVKKLWFDFFTGKKYIEALKPDAVFSLQNIITFGSGFPQTVYIHQSIPFQTVKSFSFFKATERKLAVYQHIIGRIIKKSAAKSNKVIVQTQWMKNAVCEQCGIPAEKVYKVTPTVDLSSVSVSETEFDNQSFFYPTGEGIYKNNKMIFDACEKLDQKGLEYKMVTTLDNNKSSGRVECVGRMPYDDVIARYSQSTLVFPSYIETFGYPLAEARMMGAIVLASDTPFSREVLEGYDNAYFFDPFAPSQLAELMSKVINGEITKRNVTEVSFKARDSWLEVMDIITAD